MTLKTMIGNEKLMIISIRIFFFAVFGFCSQIILKNLLYNSACVNVTIFVYLPDQITCQAVDLKGYLSDSSVIPWLFNRGMTTSLIIVGSSATKLAMNRMMRGEEMMTTATIASSSETMMTIKTMISNKEMLAILVVVVQTSVQQGSNNYNQYEDDADKYAQMPTGPLPTENYMSSDLTNAGIIHFNCSSFPIIVFNVINCLFIASNCNNCNNCLISTS